MKRTNQISFSALHILPIKNDNHVICDTTFKHVAVASFWLLTSPHFPRPLRPDDTFFCLSTIPQGSYALLHTIDAAQRHDHEAKLPGKSPVRPPDSCPQGSNAYHRTLSRNDHFSLPFLALFIFCNLPVQLCPGLRGARSIAPRPAGPHDPARHRHSIVPTRRIRAVLCCYWTLL